MIRIEKQEFVGVYDRPPGGAYAGYEFVGCTFAGCGILSGDDPAQRTFVRDVHLRRCKVRGCSLGPAVIEDVTIDGLSVDRSMIIFGAVFRHVTLKGRIGTLIYNPEYEWAVLPTYDARLDVAFREANAAYWASVDWALDIREARFSSVTLRGIPAHLIRRDPETQVVVTRERALEGRWRSLSFGASGFEVALGELSRSSQPDRVLVASTIGRSASGDLAALRMLREEGIAEPD